MIDEKYVFILDFCVGSVLMIELTDEEREKAASKDFEGDFESFLSTLEEKYNFRLKNCQWMVTSTYDVTFFHKDGSTSVFHKNGSTSYNYKTK